MPYSHLLLLLRAEIRRRPGRQLTAVVAIALAASVLLTSLAAMFTAFDQAPLAGDSVLAANELHLRAEDPAHPYSTALLDRIAADRRVAKVTFANRVRVIDLPGTERGGLDHERFHAPNGGMAGWGPQGRTTLWAWLADQPPMQLVAGRWPDPNAIDPIELVVPAYGIGGTPKPRHPLGDWRSLEGDTGVHRAVVVGAIDAGMQTDDSRNLPGFLVSPRAAEALAGKAHAPADARIALHRAGDVDEFAATWRPRLGDHAGRAALLDRASLAAEQAAGVTVGAAASVARTALLLAAASVLCIVLAILGSAVRERAAQYRLLRTIGASRAMLATLVLLESALLAIAGVAGSVLLAWAALAGLAPVLPFINLRGGPPDLRCVAVTFAVVSFGVLAGSAWPAWLAARDRAAEARAGDASLAWRTARRGALAAAAVACLATLLVSTSAPDSALRASLLAWVGVPAAAAVAVLLVPLMMRTVAALLLGPVAWLLRSEPRLLADQFAGDEARSGASVLAIAVGLGAFLLTLCWGASMLGAFVIDPAFPRWLVSIHPHGLDREETERVLALPGLERLQPLTLVDTRLGDAMAKPGDAVDDLSGLVVGVDATRAFAPGDGALPFVFVRGDAATAYREVAGGKACLINDWFALDHDLDVGDTVRVVVPGRGTTDGSGDVCYRIAGIVDLHGWRMVWKHNKSRQRNFKQQALVVLAADTVRADFPVAWANYLLGDADVGPEYPKDIPLVDAFAVSRGNREALEQRIAAAIDLRRSAANRSDAATAVTTTSRAVMVDDLDRTSHVLQTDWGGSAVQRLGWLPLLALILSLVPVAATQLAAMRARARELGVLRACGLGRAALLRLALGESLLVGVAAAGIALLFGLVGSWLLLRVSTIVGYHLRFVGIQPDFVVPWAWLLPGWLAAVGVCAFAALLAGWRIGRQAPATLLAEPAPSRV